MRKPALLAALLGLLTLASCGAEGSPQPPSGLRVSGTASMGFSTAN